MSKMLLEIPEYIGDEDLLNVYKAAYLCSRRCPSWLILKSYDWAIMQRKRGNCIISGFQSKIERDVFEFLAKGNQPIIKVESRSIRRRLPEIEKMLVDRGQLLLVYPFTDRYNQMNRLTASLRNKIVCEMADEIVVGYYTEKGILDKVLGELNKEWRLLQDIELL